MIYRLVAYSLIVLGLAGTLYMGIEGIYGAGYEVAPIDRLSLEGLLQDSVPPILVDVRTVDEVAAAPAPWDNVFHVPLLELEDRIIEMTTFKDRPLIVLCPTGRRSRQGAEILSMAGFDAKYLENGLNGNGSAE